MDGFCTAWTTKKTVLHAVAHCSHNRKAFLTLPPLAESYSQLQVIPACSVFPFMQFGASLLVRTALEHRGRKQTMVNETGKQPVPTSNPSHSFFFKLYYLQGYLEVSLQ